MPRRARHGRRQRLARRLGSRRSPTSPRRRSSARRATAASPTAATSAPRAARAPFLLFLNPDARIDAGVARRARRRRCAPTRRAALVGPRILDDDGSLAFSLRRFPRLRSTFAKALFLHRLLAAAPPWTDELVRDPAAYERAGTRRVGVGRLHARPPRRLRGDRRLRRGPVPLLRGHRPLPAPLAGRPRRALRARRASCATSAAPRRAPARRRRSPRAAACYYARKHRGRVAARLEALGVALDEATHALAALTRPGRAPRAPGRAARRARRRRALMRRPLLVPDALGTPGIGTTAWQQVAGLAEHGVEVTVVAATLRAAAPGGVRADRDAAAAAASRSPFRRARARPRACACTTAASPRCCAGARRRRRRPRLAARRRAHARGGARLGIPGAARAPERAHRRSRSATVERGPRASSASRADRVEPARPPPGAARARGARVRGAPTRLLCPSDFVAGTFRDAGVPRRAAAAPPLRLRPRALRRRRAARRRPRRSRSASSAAASRARACTSRCGRGWTPARAERRPLRDRRRDRPRLPRACSSRCSRTRASSEHGFVADPAALMRVARRARAARRSRRAARS